MEADVRLELNTIQKYILAEGDGKIFLWGNPAATLHKDIVDELSVSNVVVKGGGKIKVVPEHTQVYIWERSTRYGEAPIDEVKAILEDFYPGFSILQEQPPV